MIQPKTELSSCILIINQVALTVNSRVIKTFIEWSPDATDVPLGNGLRIQVLPCVDDLPKARKNQCAAFLAAESLLVVWDDDPTNVVARATTIEDELMDLVWKAGEPANVDQGSETEKAPPVAEVEVDEETGQALPEQRPTNIINAIQVAITIMLIITMLGLGYRQLAFQILVDKGFIRLAFIVMTPVLIFFSLVSLRTAACCIVVNTITVLCPSHCHQSLANLWSYPPDADQLEVLLCSTTASNQRNAPSYHRTMSCLQGGSFIGHCAYRAIDQTGHIYI
jgi:hypothetical protein